MKKGRSPWEWKWETRDFVYPKEESPLGMTNERIDGNNHIEYGGSYQQT
jgi:hypothetical protein